MRCLLAIAAALVVIGAAAPPTVADQQHPDLAPLATLGAASWRSVATHSRSRRNLNELDSNGHHGHHGAHGAHGHHGDHAAHGDHGEHGAHGHAAPAKNDELSVWTLIGHTDKFGCVAKFTCLLEAKYQQKTMTSQEAIVHRYITKKPREADLVEMSILKAPYYFAAFVGNRFGSEMCARFFPDCHHNFPEMQQFVNKFNIVSSGERS